MIPHGWNFICNMLFKCITQIGMHTLDSLHVFGNFHELMIHYLLCRVCGYAWFVDMSDVADTWEDMRLRE